MSWWIKITKEDDGPFILQASDHPERFHTHILLAALNKALEWMREWTRGKEEANV